MTWLLILIVYACSAGCVAEKAEYGVATEALCHSRGAAFAPGRSSMHREYYGPGPHAVYWCVPVGESK